MGGIAKRNTIEVFNRILYVFLRTTPNNYTAQSKCQVTGSTTLDVLPSNRGGSVNRNSQSIETETVLNLARRNSGVLQSSKDLPLRDGSSGATGTAVGSGTVGSWASHEASCALALEAPVAERGTGGVVEGAIGGTSRLVGGVGRGEAQGTLVINVDGLATGDLDVLDIKLANLNIGKMHGCMDGYY